MWMRVCVASVWMVSVTLPGCAADDPGESEGATASTSSGEQGSGSGDGDGEVGGSAACENPEPLTSPATGMPTGFVRCSDGFIHREEAVGIPWAETPSNPSCVLGADDCVTDADCNGGSPGGLSRCVELFDCSPSCRCVGSCEVDDDCGPGHACVDAALTGDVPRCAPAGCRDSSQCGDGLCGISVMKNDDDSHPTIELACMTDSSACRMDNCTLSDISDASSWAEPACLAVDGQWTCVATGSFCG